jgi:hypothetical protein
LQDDVLDFVWRDWENSRVHLSQDNRKLARFISAICIILLDGPVLVKLVCSMASIFNKSGKISRDFCFPG